MAKTVRTAINVTIAINMMRGGMAFKGRMEEKNSHRPGEIPVFNFRAIKKASQAIKGQRTHPERPPVDQNPSNAIPIRKTPLLSCPQ